VKYREPWRPFCPSVLAEAAGEFLAVPGDAPFMIVANQVAPKHADRIESVVHVDGSIRPQTVRADLAPDFYEAIKTFGEITGVPCVLNTSFNVKGEPIVIDPLSAIRCFFGTGLDALAIGSYLLEKPG
jgi:carbamoyltransferase